MRILFVCRANVGRSQMAASCYNFMTNTKDADSAGTDVDIPSETLSQRKVRTGVTFTIEAMTEEGIDVSDNVITQLTEAMLNNYDKVISMADAEYTPEWLKNSPNYISWTIEDPGGKGLAKNIEARDKIKTKIVEYLSKQ